MNFIAAIFLLTLSSSTVFCAPAKDGAITNADTNLDVNEKLLEKSADVKSEKTDDKADLKTSETSLKAEDKVALDTEDLKKEESTEVKGLQEKEKSQNNDNVPADDLKKEDNIEIKKLDAKDKVILSDDAPAISKKDTKIEDKEVVKSSDSKKKEAEKNERDSEIEKNVLKKVENSELKPLKAEEKTVNTNDISANENNVPKTNVETKPVEDPKISVPSYDVKVTDFDPKFLEAFPEIRTLSEVKSELKESLDKLRKISKKEKPVVHQADDSGKAEISVSTTNESKPFSIIKNFATAAGNFISSLIQLPITFLSSLQQIFVDLGVSKPGLSSSQVGFSALLGTGTGTTNPPY